MRLWGFFALLVFCIATGCSSHYGLLPQRPICEVAPASLDDPSESGTYPVASTEYKFVDAVNIPPNDPNIDVWATVRYPAASAGIDAPIAPGNAQFPLVVYLHGNHGTTVSGNTHVCGGKGPVVPNHEGYNYVLDRLASHGMIAVSINANELNCHEDRIQERGKLILEHLRRWKEWNDPNQPDVTFGGRFYKRVDFEKIGLAGHSRGGEAIVSAYLENKATGLKFGIKALHPIAPTYFTRSVLEDVPYYVLLPAADGELERFDGARTYDRAAPRENPRRMSKMQLFVHGANHRWFNTVWVEDVDDGQPPAGTSGRLTPKNQQSIEQVTAVAFFRQFLQDFAPARRLFTGTAAVASLGKFKIYRSYQDPEHLNVDDFEDRSGLALNSLGGMNASGMLSPVSEEYLWEPRDNTAESSYFHETSGLLAGWQRMSDQAYFRLSIPTDRMKDLSAYPYLSFRIMQIVGKEIPVKQDQDLDLDVGLEDKHGGTAFVRVGMYDRLPFPYARPDSLISMLQTVRLGVACFSSELHMGIDSTSIKAIHFRFNRQPAGLVGIDSIQFSK